ncbi:hypothetical protein ACQEU3_43785 [Spirillospora sp. CA-253888]
MTKPLKVEYRPATDLKDRYISAETKMWHNILLVLALIGVVVLIANLAADFMPMRGAVFLYTAVMFLFVVLMFNHTWGRLERLIRDQEKMLSMYIAYMGQNEGGYAAHSPQVPAQPAPPPAQPAAQAPQPRPDMPDGAPPQAPPPGA